MSVLADWRVPISDPLVHKRFVAHQLERVVFLGRVGCGVAVVSFLAYGVWDFMISAEAVTKTLPIRLAAVAYFILAFALTFWRPIRSNARVWFGFIFLAYLVIAVAYATVLTMLPGGFTAGLPGFLLGMILTPVVVITVTEAFVLLLPLLVVPLLIMYFNGATTFELFNGVAWLGGGTAFVVGFASFIEIINRRSFELERSLELEKQRAEALLLNILPEKIAERLKAAEARIADDFPAATVLFGDIVGFTDLSRRLSANQIVTLLNDLFSRFDRLVERHGVEKIKTIGDGYMAAAGVPTSRIDHANAIARLALDMRDAFHEFRREHNLNLKFRIGIHSGSVVAGVIGARKFAYDLWGDTVNVASRMESQGLPDEIQMSAETCELLPDAYVIEERGAIEVKGHSPKRTFLLKGLREPS